jgi:fructose-bisphosphate aldolase class II
MTIFYDNAPAALRQEMYAWLDKNSVSERKPGMTDEQFYYKARKNAIGAFKAQMYALPQADRAKLSAAWEAQFAKLFQLLGMQGTRKYVDQFVRPARVPGDTAFYLGKEAAAALADDLQD